jgi:hypothetical protein
MLVPVGETKMKRTTMLCCWILLLGCHKVFGAVPNTLSGVGEGKVFFNVTQPPAMVELSYRPQYGWDEPIALFGPDGRLMARHRLGHKSAGSKSFRLDRGPGIYVLLLKPSYTYEIATSSAGMVFAPDGQGPALFKTYGRRRLTFRVPDGTPQFSLSFSNVFNFKGRAARLALFNPSGKQVAERNRPRVHRDSLLKEVAGTTHQKLQKGQKGSYLTLSAQPAALQTSRIRIDTPRPGFWSLDIGALNSSGGRIGIALKGIPNYLAGSPQHWFEPCFNASAVRVCATIVPLESGQRPVLGMVGHMGRPNGPEEDLLKKYGQQADKLFVWPRDLIATEKGPALRHAERYDPAHGSYSLVILRALDQAADPQDLCRQTARALLDGMERNPDSFCLQVFNEPNLAFSFNTYLNRFLDCAGAVKQDPATRSVHFAGPGLGSGEESDILDWRWLEQLIKQADQYVDLISWNLYRVKDLQDTYLYAEAIEKVWTMIRQADRDGQLEPILIGATNRQGGLSADELFNGSEAGLWWASTLSQVINTGKIKGIYYFNTIDHQGWGRKKGMFDHHRRPKPQAHVQRLFSQLLQSEYLYAVRSDHGFLEGVAAKHHGQMQVVLLNKGWHRLNVDLKPEGPWTVQRLSPDGELFRVPWSAPLKMDAGQILRLTRQ